MPPEIDAGLQRALAAADPDQVVRVIGELDVPVGASAPREDEQFHSREDYRRAQIARQSAALSKKVPEIVERLRSTGAEVHAMTSSPMVILSGTPDQIRQSVEVEGVKRLYLDDEEFGLIQPRRSRKDKEPQE